MNEPLARALRPGGVYAFAPFRCPHRGHLRCAHARLRVNPFIKPDGIPECCWCFGWYPAHPACGCGCHLRPRSEAVPTCVGCAAGDHCQGAEEGCRCACPIEDPEPALDSATATGGRLPRLGRRAHPGVLPCIGGSVRAADRMARVPLQPLRAQPAFVRCGRVPVRREDMGEREPVGRLGRRFGVLCPSERRGRGVDRGAHRLVAVGGMLR